MADVTTSDVTGWRLILFTVVLGKPRADAIGVQDVRVQHLKWSDVGLTPHGCAVQCTGMWRIVGM